MGMAGYGSPGLIVTPLLVKLNRNEGYGVAINVFPVRFLLLSFYPELNMLRDDCAKPYPLLSSHLGG